MNFSTTQKRIIIELIKDKFHTNKENIQYCENYIKDAFLMEETKEQRKRNIESNKQLITETRLEQRELFKLLNKFTLNEVEV
tara:strand:- start:444 stop:689 length:246 start_codon:yes stop_codon:yes gene_type:complete